MYKCTWTVYVLPFSLQRSAVWKYLLAIVALQLIVAFVSYAIVRVGAEHDADEEEGSGGTDARPATAARIA